MYSEFQTINKVDTLGKVNPDSSIKDRKVAFSESFSHCTSRLVFVGKTRVAAIFPLMWVVELCSVTDMNPILVSPVEIHSVKLLTL